MSQLYAVTVTPPRLCPYGYGKRCISRIALLVMNEELPSIISKHFNLGQRSWPAAGYRIRSWPAVRDSCERIVVDWGSGKDDSDDGGDSDDDGTDRQLKDPSRCPPSNPGL